MNSFTTVSRYDEPFLSLFPASTESHSSKRKLRIHGVAVIGFVSVALALATAGECHSIFYPPSLFYGFVLWGWWGAIACAAWKLGQRFPSGVDFSPKTMPLHLLLACCLGVTHLLLLGALGFTVTGWERHATARAVWTGMLNVNRFGFELLIYGLVYGVLAIVQFQMRAQRDALRALELQKQLSAAHLQALQMQLEPHFLFNTLNAITTLIELGRPCQAAEMLGHLNLILKSTLRSSTPERVPLSQELELVENYLAIEQVRFADRLRVEIKVDPEALDGRVPCYLLQPIVENAIRHGIARCENDGRVEACAWRDGDRLHLQVRDNGPASPEKLQSGHGIGLTNTRERLAHFYPGAYDLKAAPSGSGGFEVSIAIPYEQ